MRNAVSSIALILLAVPALALGQASTPTFEQAVQPMLKQHCYGCHGPEKQKSNVRFDRLERYDTADQTLWTQVHEMVAAGEMPPKDQPPLSAEEKKGLLSWIEQQQASLRDASTRRLNRRELSAALQDVTGLKVDYAAALPADAKVAGFDTGAAGLQDAADSIARLLDITRRAVDGVRFLEPPRGKVLSADLKTADDPRRTLDDWKKRDLAYVKVRGDKLEGAGLLLEPRWLGERGGLEFRVTPPANNHGVVRLLITVSAFKPMKGLPNPHLLVEVAGSDVEYREITGTVDDPQVLVYEVQIDDLPIGDRGVEIQLSTRIEMPYGVDGFENEQRAKPEDNVPHSLYRPDYRKMKLPPEKQPTPFVVLQRIEIDPDHVAAWPPAKWQADIGQLRDDPEVAKRLLKLWTERAWRRPVDDREIERFFALYEKLRGQDMSFDNALRASFQSVLLSGRFRFLASPDDEDPVVAQHAIASRLSFMLIGSPPDAELRRLAAEAKLRDPEMLNQQVDRLLADPRSERFFEPFVMQWLEMEQPITLAMDNIQQQDFRFGRYLKQSMRAETIQYIAQLFADNRPAGELIDSDWTMMNNSLAWHYGYDGVEGGHLRKTKLRSDDPRGGGVLSHAGIQSMLCWMGENWVIYRGAWAMRHILDDPPPPPPLEVPELDPSAGDNRGKTSRELLKQHQENPNCSVCHKDMDPLGFAFQNFDLSGRWREVEYEKYVTNELDGKIEWRGEGKTRPVDTLGRLPRGQQFETFDQAKQLIAEHYIDDVVRGILKNFTVYAAGRKPHVADMATIRSILDEQRKKGYPMREVMKAFVRSRVLLEE